MAITGEIRKNTVDFADFGKHENEIVTIKGTALNSSKYALNVAIAEILSEYIFYPPHSGAVRYRGIFSAPFPLAERYFFRRDRL